MILPWKIYKDITVINSTWFTSADGTVGIVLIEVEPGKELKAYIGQVPGHNEKTDIKRLVDFGCTFPLRVALTLFRTYNGRIEELKNELHEFLAVRGYIGADVGDNYRKMFEEWAINKIAFLEKAIGTRTDE